MFLGRLPAAGGGRNRALRSNRLAPSAFSGLLRAAGPPVAVTAPIPSAMQPIEIKSSDLRNSSVGLPALESFDNKPDDKDEFADKRIQRNLNTPLGD